MTQTVPGLAVCVPLVVDDEAFSLSIIARVLKDLGCPTILEAKSGQHALDTYAALKKPDFSIVDFNMPGLNGLQILKAVRTGRTGVPRDHRLLLLTGNADLDLVHAAIALDVDSFVVKPASKQTLATRLEKVLSERPPLKSVEEYETVDIDTVNKQFLGHAPVGLVWAPSDPDNRADFMEKSVPLPLVQAGAILARSIRSPSGELLIGRGTPLTDRLIRRLRELQDVLGLTRVDVLVPLPEKNDR